jgi:hypothetical protein
MDRVLVDSLDADRRRALADQLFTIFSETVHGWSRGDFDKNVFAPRTRLALCYGEDHTLAGFVYAHAERLARGRYACGVPRRGALSPRLPGRSLGRSFWSR